MVRISNGLARHKRHKKYRNLAKGFRLGRKNVYNQIRLALLKQSNHAYRNRKEKKREFRALWIERLSAALKSKDIKYSIFMNKLYTNRILLNRKVLSNISLAFPEVFDKIVEEVK